MTVLCTLIMTLNAGTFNIVSSEQVKGNVLIDSYTIYMVDFSNDIKNFGIKSGYDRKLVDKEDCVKL